MGLVLTSSSNDIAATRPTPPMIASRYFFITKSPFITKIFLDRFSKTSFVASCCLLRGENRITLDINPVCCLRRDVAAQGIYFEVSCDLFIGRIGFEKGPSPAVTPERIAGIASFFVFDHDEPHFGSRGPMPLPGRQCAVIGPEDFFDEYGSIRELASLAVILSRARRSVGVVALPPLFARTATRHWYCTEHGKRSEYL